MEARTHVHSYVHTYIQTYMRHTYIQDFVPGHPNLTYMTHDDFAQMHMHQCQACLNHIGVLPALGILHAREAPPAPLTRYCARSGGLDGGGGETGPC